MNELLKQINEIEDIKEKAKVFAIYAHKDQVRKSDIDKPMVMHSISAGNILLEYNYSDSLVAASYLHDVIEDTIYTFDDIKSYFGDEIATLVKDASEEDKTLSWEERKKNSIEKTKNLPLESKLVICSDKISNLEDLDIIIRKSSKRDFSCFKRGEEFQKWYYTSMYESLINGEDKELEIFKRLKRSLDNVFEPKEDSFLRNKIFINNEEYYNKLKKLHALKEELKRLKELCLFAKPFVIEFCGTPRTGKTTAIEMLYEFYRKGGFNVSLIEEFTTSRRFKEELKIKYKDLSTKDRNIAIIKEVHKDLINEINNNPDIIIIDRSLNDRQIWNYRMYQNGYIDKDDYEKLRDNYAIIAKELIDYLVITKADSIVSLRRDYLSSLSLEKRNFLNIQNIDEYNNALEALEDLFINNNNNLSLIDTTHLNINELPETICETSMILMRKKYIDSFKNKYNI